MGGAVETSPEQQDVLASIVEGLDEDALATLFNGGDKVQIVIRKPPVSEVWVRAD